ncbi:CDP-diacylglycerol--serine O-phosphatidyltransferase [Endothiovibrio diazotrophicus]
MNSDSKPRRGIYLLPNLFTTAGLFAGFYAIILSMAGRFETAAVAIFVAMVMDGLDGRVARLTNTQSAFGVEYDSLADMASFGLAPALVAYQWSLIHFAEMGAAWAKLGWLAAFVYAAGAALRLARFNTQVGTADRRYFQGLPSPAAAAVVAGFVWAADDLGFDGNTLLWGTFFLVIASGVLMVSNIRYHSFKDMHLKNRVPFVALLVVVLAFIFASIDPPKVLFGVVFLYALSGPLLTIFHLRRRRAERELRTEARVAEEAGEKGEGGLP